MKKKEKEIKQESKQEIPKDIQEMLKKLSENSDVSIENLRKELKEIFQTDATVQSIPNFITQIRYASGKLYRKYTKKGDISEFYVMPISTPSFRKTHDKKGEDLCVGNICALVRKISKGDDGKETIDDTLYAYGTLWRDGAKNLKNLENGKVYRSTLTSNPKKWGTVLSSDDATFIEIRDGNKLMPSFKKFYAEEIKPKETEIFISDIERFGSDSETDIRTLDTVVIDSRTGETQDYREYGLYLVVDDSNVGKESFSIFVSIEDVVWTQGSKLIFGGTIDVNGDKPRWNHHFLLPIEGVPREITVKPYMEKTDRVDTETESDETETPDNEPNTNDIEDGDYEV